VKIVSWLTNLKVTVDHAVCGTSKDAEDVVVSPEMGLRNAVVSLLAPPPDAKWTVAPPVQIDQKQCVFVQRPGRVRSPERSTGHIHPAGLAREPGHREEGRDRATVVTVEMRGK